MNKARWHQRVENVSSRSESLERYVPDREGREPVEPEKRHIKRGGRDGPDGRRDETKCRVYRLRGVLDQVIEEFGKEAWSEGGAGEGRRRGG